MRVDSKALLTRCGIRDPGATSFSCACPACQTADSLVVRGSEDLYCLKCKFIGDAVEMYATVSKKSMQLAVAELLMEGLISFNEEGEESLYVGARALNRTAIDFYRQTAQLLRRNIPSSVSVQLAEFKCQFNPPSIAKMADHMVCFQAMDVPDALRTNANRPILSLIGRYSVLALPVWAGSILAGFYLLHATELVNGYVYLPLLADQGYAYAKTIETHHDHCIIANDPVVALRLMSRQCFEKGRYVTPVVVPAGAHDNRQCIPTRHTIFLPCPTAGPNYAEWYVRACNFPGSETVQDWKLGFTIRSSWPKPITGPTIGIDEILRWMRDQTIDSHHALGAMLLSKAAGDAARLVMSFDLTGPERAKIMSFFDGHDVVRLAELLATEKTVASIRLDGDLIEETSEGWVKGKVLISDATIHFTHMRTDATTAASVLSGIVTVRGKAIPFKEDYAVLRKGMAAWLDKLVRLHGEWARINTKWGPKLLDIARAFSTDMSMNASDRPAGWVSKGSLVFPAFTVDTAGVHRCINNVEGPEIPYPRPMSTTDLDSFTSQAFCQVFMALLGNLVRTAADSSGFGIVVKNAPHLPERIAAALGVAFHRDASPEAVAGNARAPLPLFGTWEPGALTAMMKPKGPKHVFMSVDEKTFDLLGAEPGWLRLNVVSLDNYDALRGLFELLVHLLGADNQVGSPAFHRDMAQKLITATRTRIERSFLKVAGGMLDAAVVDERNTGTNSLVLLHQLTAAGRLRVTAVEEGYRLDKTDVDRALASRWLPNSNFKRVSYFLGEAKMLVVNAPDHIVVNRESWNLVGSLAL